MLNKAVVRRTLWRMPKSKVRFANLGGTSGGGGGDFCTRRAAVLPADLRSRRRRRPCSGGWRCWAMPPSWRGPMSGADVTKAALDAASLADAVKADGLAAGLLRYQREQQPFGSGWWRSAAKKAPISAASSSRASSATRRSSGGTSPTRAARPEVERGEPAQRAGGRAPIPIRQLAVIVELSPVGFVAPIGRGHGQWISAHRCLRPAGISGLARLCARKHATRAIAGARGRGQVPATLRLLCSPLHLSNRPGLVPAARCNGANTNQILILTVYSICSQ